MSRRETWIAKQEQPSRNSSSSSSARARRLSSSPTNIHPFPLITAFLLSPMAPLRARKGRRNEHYSQEESEGNVGSSRPFHRGDRCSCGRVVGSWINSRNIRRLEERPERELSQDTSCPRHYDLGGFW